LEFLVNFVGALTFILMIAIVGRSVLSWVNLGDDHPIVVIVYRTTEPILGPIRRLLPNTGTLDLSPLAALVGLMLIRYVINRIGG
jgi:YggT family protein